MTFSFGRGTRRAETGALSGNPDPDHEELQVILDTWAAEFDSHDG